MTVANLITMLRVVLVPLILWAILTDNAVLAFCIFLLAGLSDAVDGIVARNFEQQSELGTILDPIADKLMLVSVFVVLVQIEQLPLWLGILAVSRDLLIISGVVLIFMMGRPVEISPIWVSKATTAAQISLAAFVLGRLAFNLELPNMQFVLEIATGVLTAVSAVAYIIQGLVLLSTENDPPETLGTAKHANQNSMAHSGGVSDVKPVIDKVKATPHDKRT